MLTVQGYYDLLEKNIRQFRDYTYSISPALGLEVDKMITTGATMGDPATGASPSTLDSVLNQIVNGFKALAGTAVASDAAYYNAVTAGNNIQAASKAGMSLDAYLASVTPGRIAAAATSVPNSNTMNSALLGIPVWVWFAGAGFILLSQSKKR